MPNYHFSLLAEDGQAIDTMDLACPNDEAALEQARALLPACHTVEIHHGARLLDQIVQNADSTVQSGAVPRPASKWWFQASPAPAWLGRKPNEASRS